MSPLLNNCGNVYITVAACVYLVLTVYLTIYRGTEEEDEDEEMDEVKSQDSDSDMEVEQSHNSLKSDSQNPVQQNKDFDWLNDLHKAQNKEDLNHVVLHTTDWISELNT